ncbi:MAG: hypothetical protein HY791_08245 [Deltaproteobacteria bacterium]|nr:hypothetical protein [Deltaproteobacteria bacterium]
MRLRPIRARSLEHTLAAEAPQEPRSSARPVDSCEVARESKRPAEPVSEALRGDSSLRRARLLASTVPGTWELLEPFVQARVGAGVEVGSILGPRPASTPPSVHRPGLGPLEIGGARALAPTWLVRATRGDDSGHASLVRARPVLRPEIAKALIEKLGVLTSRGASDTERKAALAALLEVPSHLEDNESIFPEFLRLILAKRDELVCVPLDEQDSGLVASLAKHFGSDEAAVLLGLVATLPPQELDVSSQGLRSMTYSKDPSAYARAGLFDSFRLVAEAFSKASRSELEYLCRDLLSSWEMPGPHDPLIKWTGTLYSRALMTLHRGPTQNWLEDSIAEKSATKCCPLFEYALVAEPEKRLSILETISQADFELAEKYLAAVPLDAWTKLSGVLAKDVTRAVHSLEMTTDPTRRAEIADGIRRTMEAASEWTDARDLLTAALRADSTASPPARSQTPLTIRAAGASPRTNAKPAEAARLSRADFVVDPTRISKKSSTPPVQAGLFLRFLYSDAAWPYMQALRARLEAAGVPFSREAAEKTGYLPVPHDPTLSRLARHLYEYVGDPEEFAFALAAAIVHMAPSTSNWDEHVVHTDQGDLFSRLASLAATSNPGSPRPRLRHRYLSSSNARGAGEADKIVARMRVLANLVQSLEKSKPLDGMRMVAVQHLFPSTRGLVNGLAALGIDSKTSKVLGKPYSTDPETFAGLLKDHFNLSQLGVLAEHGGSEWARRKLYRMVAPELRDRLAKIPANEVPAALELAETIASMPKLQPGERDLLLLDEGGKLVKALHRYFPEHVDRVVALEQTENGIQTLQAMREAGTEIRCPVVNMAQSVAKKTFESPMIGESVVTSIEASLRSLSSDSPIALPDRAAIIGFGAVGRATAHALTRRGIDPARIWVYDTDPSKRAEAEKAGFSVGSRDEVLAQGALLVSCTGHTTLTPDEYEKLPNRAIMANAASGNHELGADKLPSCHEALTPDPLESKDSAGFRRSKFGGTEIALGDLAAADEMFHRVLRGPSSERLLLRSGYVVNMTDDIPPEYAQLIRSLLLAGCAQAAQSVEPGLIELDRVAQETIVSKVEADLKRQGLGGLLVPRFGQVRVD